MWRVTVAIVACMCAMSCATAGRAPESGRVTVALELVGLARASVVTGWHRLPTGPGAEGGIGDLLLENERVRFVVAAADHHGLGSRAGNVIDAAVQGGEDRMRLLAPLVGPGAGVAPVYETARVDHPGGEGETASVVCEGRLPGRPEVRVTTTYTLEPGERALELTTVLSNETARTLPGCRLGDLLYHGRTLRYDPAVGLRPMGKTNVSPYFAFFRHDLAWGIRPGQLGTITAVHHAGTSELNYAVTDLSPGQSTRYTRRLLATTGGVHRVWEGFYPVRDEDASRLTIVTKCRRRGERIPGAEVTLTPTDGRPPTVVVTGPDGAADVRLRAGQYRTMASAPGRVAVGPLLIDTGEGSRHRIVIQLPPPSEAHVTVQAAFDGFQAPLSARVVAYSQGGAGEPCPPRPVFPLAGPAGVAFTDGVRPAVLSLLRRREDTPETCVLVASRGPLFDGALVGVKADSGSLIEEVLSITRVVDPGDYVAVDFRQHTSAGPDSALTVGERTSANAVEGLDAAIACDPVPCTAPAGNGPPGSLLLSGMRVEADGFGAFSLYPLGRPPEFGDGAHAWQAAVSADVYGMLAAGEGPPAVLGALRQAYPDALLQVNAPLDPRTGYYDCAGLMPRRGREPRLPDLDFDALEILTGSDSAGARQLLPCWFALLNAGRRVMVTGGSASRALWGQVGGIARTYVHCPGGGDIEAAILRLKDQPNAFVTNGPFIEATVNGRPIGSTQTVTDGTARMELRVLAPRWVSVSRITVYANGEPVREVPVNGPESAARCDLGLDLAVGGDCWFAVVVEGDAPMQIIYGSANAPTPFAVTNPFWVDADGDGKVRIR